jgi:hypothetical protein
MMKACLAKPTAPVAWTTKKSPSAQIDDFKRKNTIFG